MGPDTAIDYAPIWQSLLEALSAEVFLMWGANHGPHRQKRGNELILLYLLHGPTHTFRSQQLLQQHQKNLRRNTVVPWIKSWPCKSFLMNHHNENCMRITAFNNNSTRSTNVRNTGLLLCAIRFLWRDRPLVVAYPNWSHSISSKRERHLKRLVPYLVRQDH